MRRYTFGTAGHAFVVSQVVIDHFDRHRQVRCWHREAGGLLFARFEGTSVVVDLATGPRTRDKRTRYGYRPDRVSEQREIDENHARGLHFIGTWHTHPEDDPKPSGVDLASVADIFERSRHFLNGFAMVIVGRVPSPGGIYVGLWDGTVMHTLAEDLGDGGRPVRATQCAKS